MLYDILIPIMRNKDIIIYNSNNYFAILVRSTGHLDLILPPSVVKCILPHWIMNSTLPYCQGKQWTRIGTKFNGIRNNIPPCQEIEKIIYTYNEINGLENFVGKVGCSTGKCMSDYMKRLGINYNHPSNDVIQVQLTFQGERYMVITQVRAYDGQSLIGNAGGYVGLFLGVALIQLPAAFQYFFQILKK